MREKMLKLPPEFQTGQPFERFKRLTEALMAVPKKELDEPKKTETKQPNGKKPKLRRA